MTKKVEISKIVIEIGDKKIELGIKEAKELQKLLNDTFGKKETVYIPGSPIYIERPWITHPYPYWTVTYDNVTNIGITGTTTGYNSGQITYTCSNDNLAGK